MVEISVTTTAQQGKEYHVQCAHCGDGFVTQYETKRYCSGRCSAAASRRRWIERPGNRERHNEYHRDNQRRIRGVEVKSYTCDECGAPTVKHHRKARFCSKACGDKNRCRVKDARRRAREGVSFDPIGVLERDGWRCGLCGKKTIKSKRGTTHPRAPELDHIVPLAAGGEHTPVNTQCACRDCNIRKGAKSLGQMRLWG